MIKKTKILFCVIGLFFAINVFGIVDFSRTEHQTNNSSYTKILHPKDKAEKILRSSALLFLGSIGIYLWVRAFKPPSKGLFLLVGAGLLLSYFLAIVGLLKSTENTSPIAKTLGRLVFIEMSLLLVVVLLLLLYAA